MCCLLNTLISCLCQTVSCITNEVKTICQCPQPCQCNQPQPCPQPCPPQPCPQPCPQFQQQWAQGQAQNQNSWVGY